MEEKKEKKEKKPKSTLTKIIIGVLIAVIVFILICMAPFLYFCALVLWEMLFVHPDKPQIEQAEIPFVVEYEYDGEIRTIEDAMVYEYKGDSFSLDGGNTRDWDAEMRDSDDFGYYYIDPETYPELYIYVELDAEYYMGAPDYKWTPEPPCIRYWDEETDMEYWDVQEIEEFGLKILGWSDPQPIENTFD